MNFNFVLCENLSLPSFKCVGKKRKSKRISSSVNEIIKDVNTLLANPDFDHKFICNHLLNKFVQITGSEYGFLGKVIYTDENKPILRTYAITNIAWNLSSQKFFLDHINTSLCFTNMDTMFGEVIVTGRPKMVNNYQSMNRSDILPNGHPPIKRFLGVPAMIGKSPIAMLGVCNKLTKYTKKDIHNISNLLSVFSYLLIDISKYHHPHTTIHAKLNKHKRKRIRKKKS